MYTSHLPSPTGIPTDPALSSHGVDQSHELAAHLISIAGGGAGKDAKPLSSDGNPSGHLPPIDVVYSSPYYRCLQTMAPYARRANIRVRVDPGLGEWYGSAERFEHPTSAPLEVLARLFPDVLDTRWGTDTGAENGMGAYDDVGNPAKAWAGDGNDGTSKDPQRQMSRDTKQPTLIHPSRNGETVAELHDRVALAAETLIARCDAEGARGVLICSHAATIIALGRVLTGRMPEDVGEEDFGAFTCGVSVFRRRTKSRGERTSNASGPEGSTATTDAAGNVEGGLPAGSHEGKDGKYRRAVWVLV